MTFYSFFQDKLGFSAAAKACKMPPAGCLKMIPIHKKWIPFLMLLLKNAIKSSRTDPKSMRTEAEMGTCAASAGCIRHHFSTLQNLQWHTLFLKSTLWSIINIHTCEPLNARLSSDMEKITQSSTLRSMRLTPPYFSQTPKEEIHYSTTTHLAGLQIGL